MSYDDDAYEELTVKADNIIGQCHLLYTDLVLASGSTEWEVEWDGKHFVVTTNDPEQFAPPPIKDASKESRNVWREWFRVQRS